MSNGVSDTSGVRENDGVELYRDKSANWRWRVKAANGRIVADSSEGYVNFIDCVSGLSVAAAILSGTAGKSEEM